LSIDGGGIRGIIPCKVLMYIEERFGGEVGIAELFDLIAGTSTGGILAAGLTLKEKDKEGNYTGKLKYKAEDLLPLYSGEEAKQIFAKSKLFLLKYPRQWFFRSKFPGANIESILQEKFGEDAKLSEAYTKLLITSYNIEQRTPFYFKSTDVEKYGEAEDFPIWEIARSTSAAPTYFPPYRTKKYGGFFRHEDVDGNEVREQLDRVTLVDGGMFANNPSLLAYIEAREEIWKRSPQYKMWSELMKDAAGRGMLAEAGSQDFEVPFFLLSIGTGQSRKEYKYDKARKWGQAQWALPSIDILMQGVSESVHYQMSYLLPPFNNPEKTPRYIRINIELDKEHASMDDASDENTTRLRDFYGDKIIENNRDKLDEACNILKQIYDLRMARRQDEA